MDVCSPNKNCSEYPNSLGNGPRDLLAASAPRHPGIEKRLENFRSFGFISSFSSSLHPPLPLLPSLSSSPELLAVWELLLR